MKKIDLKNIGKDDLWNLLQNAEDAIDKQETLIEALLNVIDVDSISSSFRTNMRLVEQGKDPKSDTLHIYVEDD